LGMCTTITRIAKWRLSTWWVGVIIHVNTEQHLFR